MSEEKKELDQEVIYVDAQKRPIPIGTITTTKVYDEVERGVAMGKTLISAQGGTRSGKTVTIMIWVVLQCLERPIKVGISRKTMPVIKATVFGDFKDVMRQIGIWNEDRLNKTDMTYTFENGSNIVFFAADLAEKLKGRKNKITWLNEATEFQYSDYQQLRFRSEFMILDYNPNFSESHWINKINEDPRTYHFITTYKDNPFLPQAIVEEIESMKKTNYQYWIQFGTGQRCLSQGRIFQNIIVEDRYEWPLETYIGVDFGYGAKPSAVVKVALIPGRIIVQELLYKTDCTPHDIAVELNRHRHMQIVCDSANPLYISLVKKEMREPAQLSPVNKRGRSGAQARIGAIHSMSKCEVVIVSDEKYPSANIQKEFGEYCYKEDGNGNITNEPVEENDHGIDATRYVYMSKAPKAKRRGVTIR